MDKNEWKTLEQLDAEISKVKEKINKEWPKIIKKGEKQKYFLLLPKSVNKTTYEVLEMGTKLQTDEPGDVAQWKFAEDDDNQ